MPWLMFICGGEGPAPSSKGTAMPSLPPRTTKESTADATPAPTATKPAPAEPKQQPPPAAQQAQTGNTMPWSSAQQGAPNGAQNGADGLPNGSAAPAGGRGPPSANGGAISRSGPGAGGNPPGGNQGTSPCPPFSFADCLFLVGRNAGIGLSNQQCSIS